VDVPPRAALVEVRQPTRRALGDPQPQRPRQARLPGTPCTYRKSCSWKLHFFVASILPIHECWIAVKIINQKHMNQDSKNTCMHSLKCVIVLAGNAHIAWSPTSQKCRIGLLLPVTNLLIALCRIIPNSFISRCIRYLGTFTELGPFG
jgi:hypothetical protein